MARLLSQRQAARYLHMRVERFRAICRAGDGPAVFAPDEHTPQYVDTVLDRWVEGRDDRTSQMRSAS